MSPCGGKRNEVMGEARDYLFVYGTLLGSDRGLTGHNQRARLAREAKVIGTATLEGRLYDLGRYPGIVVPAPGESTPGDIVHGEVLALSAADETLRWLDVYEGIVPGRIAANEYERVARDVMLDDGPAVRAWVYVYGGVSRDAILIPGGRWLRT